jgi:hypothetical protein
MRSTLHALLMAWPRLAVLPVRQRRPRKPRAARHRCSALPRAALRRLGGSCSPTGRGPSRPRAKPMLLLARPRYRPHTGLASRMRPGAAAPPCHTAGCRAPHAWLAKAPPWLSCPWRVEEEGPVRNSREDQHWRRQQQGWCDVFQQILVNGEVEDEGKRSFLLPSLSINLINE